jgi:hypothetical protein
MGIWTVDPYAFEPHLRRDVDGMSFFRADFATAVQVSQANRHAYGARVARITMQQLRSLGLDADPDPNPEQLAGHTLVRGMRFVRDLSREERRKIKDLSRKLALFATRNGLYRPPGLGDPVA